MVTAAHEAGVESGTLVDQGSPRSACITQAEGAARDCRLGQLDT